MATYNFTVRAKDESGAFADREFNIEVKNTMVDRILAIDSNDGYASTDGKTWSQRTGIGGRWCDNLLGKWIVAVNNSSYRLSDDTLNWREGLSFRLANQPPVMGEDDEGNEVVVEEAGPFYDVRFSFNDKTFVEMSGQVYVVANVAGRIGLVRTSNLVDWYLVVSEDYEESHNNYFGISGTTHTTNDLSHWSGLERHNGQYVLLNGNVRSFIVSDDLVEFNPLKPNNDNVLRWRYRGAYNRASNVVIKSVNGILFINYLSASHTSRRNSNRNNRLSSNALYFTIDLNNVTVPENNVSQSTSLASVGEHTVSPMNPMIYSNGHLMTFGVNMYSITDRPTIDRRIIADRTESDVVVFDGIVLVIGKGQVQSVVPGGTPVVYEAEGLPTTRLNSIGAM